VRKGPKLGVPEIPAMEVTMMPPTTTPSVGEARRRQEGRGYGLVLFASILLLVVGCFNLIQGIAAIANSHVFVANAHYVIGNLRAWGWITLILGLLGADHHRHGRRRPVRAVRLRQPRQPPSRLARGYGED